MKQELGSLAISNFILQFKKKCQNINPQMLGKRYSNLNFPVFGFSTICLFRVAFGPDVFSGDTVYC